MTQENREAYFELSRLPKFEYYAKPRTSCSLVTNVCELLRCKETDAALCLCGREEKYRRGEVSDFEYFKELLLSLPTLKGTHVFDLLHITLLELCGEELASRKSFSEEDICLLWAAANEKIFELCGGDHNELLKKYNVEKLYRCSVDDENKECDEKCHTSDKCEALVFDFKGLDFIRPDPYHYKLATEKKNRGEKLNNDEKSIILAQEIYLLLSLKSRGKIQLHLRCDENTDTAKDIINYLKDRKFSLDIFLAFSGEGSVEKLISLCLMSDENIRIYPEIVITKTDSFENLKRRLRLLFGAYPAENIRFGGAVTDSPTFFFEHILFVRALYSVLFEIENDEQKAYEKVRKILR